MATQKEQLEELRAMVIEQQRENKELRELVKLQLEASLQKSSPYEAKVNTLRKVPEHYDLRKNMPDREKPITRLVARKYKGHGVIDAPCGDEMLPRGITYKYAKAILADIEGATEAVNDIEAGILGF